VPDPTYDPYKDRQLGYEDLFDKLIADGTSNRLNLLGNNPYSPERWRVFYDSGSTGSFTRRFIQYGDNANYNHLVDRHVLSPDQGDTMKMETGEYITYVAQYVLRPSFAYELANELSGNDKVTIAFGEADLNNGMANADGWIIEIEPSKSNANVFFGMYRDGTVVDRSEVTFEKASTIWKRVHIDLNWYNVGAAELVETYTDNGEQFNETQATVSNDNGKGPQYGSAPLEISVRNDSGNAEIQPGSIAAVVLGQPESIVRQKSWARDASINTTGTWVPQYAVRARGDLRRIKTIIDQISIVNYTATARVNAVIQSFGPEKVTFTGSDSWSVPNELSPRNSTLEARTDIDQFPNQDGTLVNSTNNIGGYQIGTSTFSVSKVQGASITSRGDRQNIKRPLHRDDVAIILFKSTDTGTATFDITTEQEW